MNTIKNVIFDLGGVLIDWNPAYVYLDVFEGDHKKMQWFFDEICTMDWNENQDAGYPLDQATEERVKMFPQYEQWIRMYYGRWEEMLGEAIEETVNILERFFQHPDYKVIALTNWSAETFPIALERFDFLHKFEGIVVSGTEKTRKPFPEIYELALDRYGLNAEETLFIDDNLRNVNAAEAMGINSVQFKNPKQLAAYISEIGLKI
ncbi:MAG: HAD family hydrolase [Gammaproteobacteria bacterium TMED119]|nr:MAG: HAD family hydrolase [Gammaproteobacteria bacterium TMED119]|tara:strand:+ start:8561 stop:9178 length:618 start_codon:yes stop_codon:yes gene_type:complete